MGLAGKRRPPLPAPTESSVFDNDSESPPPVEPSDLETNLTTRTDKTHYSIPEDGSPIVIKTEKLRARPKQNITLKNNKASGNTSQTSLLIEYFEGDQEDSEGNRKPSVRVRVTPSGKKSQGTGGGETSRGSVRITQRTASEGNSYSRQVDLGKAKEGILPLTESNISSFEGSDLSAAPIEVDLRKRDGLDVVERGRGLHTTTQDDEVSRLVPINMSEISSMPADSMLATDLGTESPTKALNRRRSRSLEREVDIEPDDMEMLKPAHQRSRSLSRERMVARRAVEKFEREARERRHKEREFESKSGVKSKSKSRSASGEHLVSSSSKTRRKSSRSYDKDDEISNPSQIAGSAVSEHSVRSGVSAASSLSKNPKLLQTVEDAIRRLIPEITAMKNEQQGQRRSGRYDDELSSNASSIRSEDRSSSRRASGSKSGPKLKLNGETIKHKRTSRRSGGEASSSVDSLKREFERAASEETIMREEKSSGRRRSKDKAKDVVAATAAATAATALTAAALTSKDSKESASSIERRERRKKRSKSHSRSESRTDSVEEIFNKHDVPPMPMTSGLTDSDLTRESILSERTSTPTHDRNREVRDLVKDSADIEFSPGGSVTPTRRHISPALDRDVGYDSGHDFRESVHLKKEPYRGELHEDGYLEEEEDEEDEYDLHNADHYAQERSYIPMAGMYSAQNYSDPTYGFQRRGLSPIQSVASYEERGEPPPTQERLQHQQSSTSVSSSAADRNVHLEESFETVSSGTADNIKRKSMRPKSINLEDPQDSLYGHESGGRARGDLSGQDIRRLGANPEFIHTPHGAESAVASLMDPSTVGERSNLSYESNDNGSPSKRYSIETDPRRESLISQERNLHTPERGSPLKREVLHEDLEEGRLPAEARYSYHRGQRSSLTPSGDAQQRRPFSATSSPFEQHPVTQSSALPVASSPMPEIGHFDDDVETNPSEIRDDPWDQKQAQHSGSANDSLRAAAKNMLLAAGAMGAGAAVVAHEKNKHSAYDPMEIDDLNSPQQSESPDGHDRDLLESPSMGRGKLGVQGVSPWQGPDFTPLQPQGDKDEGYASGIPPEVVEVRRSITPDDKSRQQTAPLFKSIDQGGDVAEDPFTTPKRERPTTADSDAMPSPLYDAAMGRGVDRIKNQDIVALMDHLTVRDAQRNARDTEILVTLVRSAAEMRNSFDDMKRILASQEERTLDVSNQQHMETRRAIGGPRAMPASRMGSNKAGAAEMNAEDVPAKKRNIFRKALRGLAGGKKEDLANIEDMLMQLLEEVAEIKATQQMVQPAPGLAAATKVSSGLTSYEQLRDATAPPSGAPASYSPSGQNSNAPRDDSSYPSANSSFRPVHNRRGSEALRPGQNRVSTVHEEEDEDADSPETQLDQRDQRILGDEDADSLLTPTGEFRGAAVATGAPQATQRQSLSADNTPNARKQRASGSGSFFPKISRWSKTTATTNSTFQGADQTPRQDQSQAQFAQQTPSKQRGQRPVSELSRSASDLGEDQYDVRDHYDPHGDDRLRSKTSLSNHSTAKEYRPPSPLIPSTVSEKPAYSAHRDSKDLQHPQPRQGPTSRFHNHLESEAARGWYGDGGAESPTSDVMGTTPVLSRFGGRERGDRYSGASYSGTNYGVQGAGELGTIKEAASGSVDGGPPRPPKVKDEGPLVPPKVPVDQQQEQQTTANAGGNTRTVSFASDRMAQIIGGSNSNSRKPSGPRPITRTGSASPAAGQAWQDWPQKKTQYRGSPNHIPSDDESETF